MSEVSILQEIRDSLSLNLSEQKDKIISAAISCHLNRADWTLEELRGRLVRAVMPNKEEVYFLDGMEFIRFALPEIAIDGGKMVGKLNYQTLKE